jgi:2-polyprenyl-6-methoxyphenol hydroxylase-like FAD-dependent oxidoreductase
MHEADIVVVGGGLAGSLASAMLARKGFDVVLVDPHAVYPPDLRCEKVDALHLEMLQRTGLAELILAAGTRYDDLWVARFGRIVEKRREHQYGILYDTLVNATRAAIPENAVFIRGKVTGIANSANRQVVTTSTGEEISARLAIIANGLNSGLRNALGMTREDLHKCHCVTVAFSLKPVGRSSFDFPALTYFTDCAAHRIAYITLFPIGDVMRANVMTYRAMDDPWLKDMREDPQQGLLPLMPSLGEFLGAAEVVGPVLVRPADLYVTHPNGQAGVVLVGDAFATSCPAAGTGCGKVFTDVERLCNVHVPQWMATEGMGAEKIAQFYADPVKVSWDRHSAEKAFRMRSVATDEGFSWRVARWARRVKWTAVHTGRDALARMTLGSP